MYTVHKRQTTEQRRETTLSFKIWAMTLTPPAWMLLSYWYAVCILLEVRLYTSPDVINQLGKINVENLEASPYVCLTEWKGRKENLKFKLEKKWGKKNLNFCLFKSIFLLFSFQSNKRKNIVMRVFFSQFSYLLLSFTFLFSFSFLSRLYRVYHNSCSLSKGPKVHSKSTS